MTLQLLQNGAQALRILGANPIQLEAVAHQNGDFGLIFRYPRLKRLDPGVELLLWQLLGQLFHALQPQLFARTGWMGGGIKGRHKTVDRSPIIHPKNNVIKNLSTGQEKQNVSGRELALISAKGSQAGGFFGIIMGFPDGSGYLNGMT